MRRHTGFTLIEVMIVVAIIAILSAIAIPSYSEYVIRSRLTEGVAALGAMRVKMEQYFQDNRTYVGACAAGTVATPPDNIPNFTIACPTATATAYTLTAIGKEKLDSGFVYQVDEKNAKSTTGAMGFASSSTCWSIRKDGSC
jgi:type IV pilus assembly protein PilE